MADAMKLVPVEPTEAMIEAMDQAVFTHGNVIDAYRAMLAASPPAREEAPAEGAAFEMSDAEMEAVSTRAVDGFASDLLALRNRTSEPEAGAVAWRDRFVVSREGREWSDWNYHDEFPPVRPTEQQVEMLYTHPAPATADKLRVAVEALEAARGHTQVTHVYAGIDAALAALNEQPQ